MTHGEYPVDMQLDSNRDIFLDDTNDISSVGGLPNLEQSLAIQAGDAIRRFLGRPITGSNVGLLEENIRQKLNDDPQVARVASVTLEEFDKRENKLTFTVTTVEDHTFRLGVEE